MKLFVAVLPPASAADELAEAVVRLRSLPGADELRWTEPVSWHFTLAFLGKPEERRLPELYERLGRAARRHEPHSVGLAGAGTFGRRALWAGARGDVRALGRLAESAAAAGRRCGAAVDERPFTAHLTLARSRTLSRSGRGGATVDLRPFAEALAGFEGSPWPVERLRLMNSEDGGAGRPPRYDTVRSWPLGRGTGG